MLLEPVVNFLFAEKISRFAVFRLFLIYSVDNKEYLRHLFLEQERIPSSASFVWVVTGLSKPSKSECLL